MATKSKNPKVEKTMSDKDSNHPDHHGKPDLVQIVEKSFGVRFSTLMWWFVAVILLAGVAFLFKDNDPTAPIGQPPVSGPKSESGSPRTGDRANTSLALKGLNTGTLENFVIHKQPMAVPEFKFLREDQTETSLRDFKGKVVLLNIWATWCAPCRHEMPSLDRVYKELGQDGQFVVLAVSIDRSGFAKPRQFFDEIGIKNLTLYLDPTGGRAARKIAGFGMPTTLLIDREGRELGRLIGPAEWDAPEAKRLIRAALGHKQVSALSRIAPFGTAKKTQ